MSERITINDLRTEVDCLNRKYKLTNRTDFMIGIEQAYGGYQVVIYDKHHGIIGILTYGYQSSRDTLEELRHRDVKSAIKYAKQDVQRQRKREIMTASKRPTSKESKRTVATKNRKEVKKYENNY